MKLLVVGGGGREHAIIKSLKKNPLVTEIFAAPGNGGIAKDATCVAIGATDTQKIVAFAIENKIDYAVVAPDDPLVLGCVDALEEKGILGGLPVEGGILWCATEKVSKEQLDQAVAIVKEVAAWN